MAQPFQAMPATGRHQFAGNPRAAAPGAAPVRPVHPRVPLQPAPSAQRVTAGKSNFPVILSVYSVRLQARYSNILV